MANVKNRHHNINIIFLKGRWFTVNSKNYDLFIKLSSDPEVENTDFYEDSEEDPARMAA